MAFLSYRLYRAKVIDEKTDIWTELNRLKGKKTDISYMSEIILKHKDFELFNWMLDPITYSNGDIHYDFFSKYTAKDMDLVEGLYNAERPDFEDTFGPLLNEEIRMSDRKKDEEQLER